MLFKKETEEKLQKIIKHLFDKYVLFDEKGRIYDGRFFLYNPEKVTFLTEDNKNFLNNDAYTAISVIKVLKYLIDNEYTNDLAETIDLFYKSADNI